SRRRHTRSKRDWSSDVCSSDLSWPRMPAELGPAQAVDAARVLLDEALRSGGRRLLGIAGAPGAGKSTLTAQLARELPAGSCAVVPMDGFHLADAALERLGRAERKGAPDTFDAAGYVALLQR